MTDTPQQKTIHVIRTFVFIRTQNRNGYGIQRNRTPKQSVNFFFHRRKKENSLFAASKTCYRNKTVQKSLVSVSSTVDQTSLSNSSSSSLIHGREARPSKQPQSHPHPSTHSTPSIPFVGRRRYPIRRLDSCRCPSIVPLFLSGDV